VLVEVDGLREHASGKPGEVIILAEKIVAPLSQQTIPASASGCWICTPDARAPCCHREIGNGSSRARSGSTPARKAEAYAPDELDVGASTMV
jgi:hypothetical protein